MTSGHCGARDDDGPSAEGRSCGADWSCGAEGWSCGAVGRSRGAGGERSVRLREQSGGRQAGRREWLGRARLLGCPDAPVRQADAVGGSADLGTRDAGIGAGDAAIGNGHAGIGHAGIGHAGIGNAGVQWVRAVAGRRHQRIGRPAHRGSDISPRGRRVRFRNIDLEMDAAHSGGARSRICHGDGGVGLPARDATARQDVGHRQRRALRIVAPAGPGASRSRCGPVHP